jgi:hypothetical protein
MGCSHGVNFQKSITSCYQERRVQGFSKCRANAEFGIIPHLTALQVPLVSVQVTILASSSTILAHPPYARRNARSSRAADHAPGANPLSLQWLHVQSCRKPVSSAGLIPAPGSTMMGRGWRPKKKCHRLRAVLRMGLASIRIETGREWTGGWQ